MHSPLHCLVRWLAHCLLPEAEAAGHIRRLVRNIRRHWPTTHITIRGDGHYGWPEVMAWCEAADVDYMLGLPTNAALRADPVIVAVADACAVRQAKAQHPVLRNYAETRYDAQSWKCQRHVVARIEASTLVMDIRYVVTSFEEGSAEHIYDTLYCARGQAKNQLRLWFALMVYVLLRVLRRIELRFTQFARASCGTTRLKLLKIGARVTVSVRRIKIAMVSA